MSADAPSRSSTTALMVALLILISVLSCAVRAVPRRAGCLIDAPHIRIDNFGCVNAKYYRGSDPNHEEYAQLAAFGIRTIIDLRGEDVDVSDGPLVRRLGMKYVHIPMSTHDPPTRAVIEQFLQHVEAPENQPVYVHCVGGRHRTGVMTAVYRVARDGWTADRAFEEMKAYRFGPAVLHRELKAFVYEFATPSGTHTPDGSTSRPCGRPHATTRRGTGRALEVVARPAIAATCSRASAGD